MPKLISAIFVFFLSTTLLTAKAITVEEILANHKLAVAVNDQAVRTQSPNESLTGYAEKGYPLALEGTERINGYACYKISVTLNAVRRIQFFVDPKNWYVISKTVIDIPEPDKYRSTLINDSAKY